MNERVNSVEAEPAARHRAYDARLLADSLRTSRVTLLYGDDGVTRTDLLTDGVLPLLRRRAGDGPSRGSRRPKAAAANAERRTGAGGRQRGSERVVLFSDWGGAPLASLEVSILSSLPMGVVVRAQNHRLPDLLAELSDGLDARFLILLDAFEQLWGPDSRDDAILEFIDQLSDAANRKGLNANFLLSVGHSAEPRLDALRSRIAGFDDSTLRLHAAAPRPTASEAAGLSELPPPPVRLAQPPLLMLADALPQAVRAERVRPKRPPRQPLSPPEPIKTETVYAFIESTLTQTAGAVEPWRDAEAHAMVQWPQAPASPREVPVAERATEGRRQAAKRADGSCPEQSGPRQLADDSPASTQPPSPIDDWLDAAMIWLRRVFGQR